MLFRSLACSSPTGPAFEGAQIAHGQRAAPGAIERVRIDPATLQRMPNPDAIRINRNKAPIAYRRALPLRLQVARHYFFPPFACVASQRTQTAVQPHTTQPARNGRSDTLWRHSRSLSSPLWPARNGRSDTLAHRLATSHCRLWPARNGRSDTLGFAGLRLRSRLWPARNGRSDTLVSPCHVYSSLLWPARNGRSDTLSAKRQAPSAKLWPARNGRSDTLRPPQLALNAQVAGGAPFKKGESVPVLLPHPSVFPGGRPPSFRIGDP